MQLAPITEYRWILVAARVVTDPYRATDEQDGLELAHARLRNAIA
jgi:hypothetical protein